MYTESSMLFLPSLAIAIAITPAGLWLKQLSLPPVLGHILWRQSQKQVRTDCL